MEKLFSFVLAIILFFCPLAIQSKEIPGESSLDPISDDAIRYLQGEEMYQGSFSWQGNKLSSKFNYDKIKKKKRLIKTH